MTARSFWAADLTTRLVLRRNSSGAGAVSAGARSVNARKDRAAYRVVRILSDPRMHLFCNCRVCAAVLRRKSLLRRYAARRCNLLRLRRRPKFETPVRVAAVSCVVGAIFPTVGAALKSFQNIGARW